MNQGTSYEILLKNIAFNIRKFRLDRNLTQQEMARLGFNYRFFQRLESGVYSPSLRTLHNLAETFGVEVTDILASAKSETTLNSVK